MQNPTPELQKLIAAEPDLVDRIFDYLLKEVPEFRDAAQRVKNAVRAEFAGEECYIQGRPREATTQQVLALFNGRNATEVARSLGISRATVYRTIKQPGTGPGKNSLKFSGK